LTEVDRLGSGPRVAGRLGLGVRVSASFKMLALMAGGMSLMGREIVQGELYKEQ